MVAQSYHPLNCRGYGSKIWILRITISSYQLVHAKMLMGLNGLMPVWPSGEPWPSPTMVFAPGSLARKWRKQFPLPTILEHHHSWEFHTTAEERLRCLPQEFTQPCSNTLKTEPARFLKQDGGGSWGSRELCQHLLLRKSYLRRLYRGKQIAGVGVEGRGWF